MLLYVELVTELEKFVFVALHSMLDRVDDSIDPVVEVSHPDNHIIDVLFFYLLALTHLPL